MIKMYSAPKIDPHIIAKQAHALLQGGGPAARQILRLESVFNELFSANTLFVNSGTSAINHILQTKNLTNKKIAVSPITFPSVISAIVRNGGIPLFTGVQWNGLSKPDHLSSAAFCVPVHLYGYNIDTRGLENVLVHDACQAFGVKLENKYLHDILNQDCAISFSWGKWLSCGEGGLVITKDLETYKKIKASRIAGLIIDDYATGKTEIEEPHLKTSQSPMSAFLVLEQFKSIEVQINESRLVKIKLHSLISPNVERVIWNPEGNHLYFGVVMKNREYREKVVKKLKEKSIEFFFGHKPAFLFNAFKNYDCLERSSCEKYWDTVLLIPSHANLNDDEIEIISNCFSI